MRNLKVIMAFRGTKYHGFQRQPNALTVQEVVEQALSTLLNEPVTIQAVPVPIPVYTHTNSVFRCKRKSRSLPGILSVAHAAICPRISPFSR